MHLLYFNVQLITQNESMLLDLRVLIVQKQGHKPNSVFSYGFMKIGYLKLGIIKMDNGLW